MIRSGDGAMNERYLIERRVFLQWLLSSTATGFAGCQGWRAQPPVDVKPKRIVEPPNPQSVPPAQRADPLHENWKGPATPVRMTNGVVYSDSPALVVGISQYTNRWDYLPGTVRDATNVANALESHGFKVGLLVDQTVTLTSSRRVVGAPVTKASIEAAIRTLAKAAAKGTRVVIYIASHGHKIEIGGHEEGYIVPGHAPKPVVGNETSFQDETVSFWKLNEFFQTTYAQSVLFMPDSCFGGMALETATRSGRSEGPKYAPSREVIASGTEHQEVSDDGLFANSFISAISRGSDADTNTDGVVSGIEIANYLAEKIVSSKRRHQIPGRRAARRFELGTIFFATGVGRVSASPR
jgi:hypothetical protein